MKKTLLKISMLIVALMFVFAGASWAEGGKNRQRNKGPEKRIESKGHPGSSYRQPVHFKPKINRQQKRYRHHPANRYRYHKFYHRNKWIRNHRQHYRHDRQYSDNSYDGDLSTNEFTIATTVSQPGVEFSIGAKRTW